MLELRELRAKTVLRVRADAAAPMEMREAAVPCRHIPLNEKDETIHSLYRCGTPEELEAVLSEWLMNMIQKLELERVQGRF